MDYYYYSFTFYSESDNETHTDNGFLIADDYEEAFQKVLCYYNDQIAVQLSLKFLSNTGVYILEDLNTLNTFEPEHTYIFVEVF